MKKSIALFVPICLILTLTGCAPPSVSSPSPSLSPTPAPNTSETPSPSSSPTPPPAMTRENPESNEQIVRRYTWSYGGNEWTLDLNMPQNLYIYYKETPRPPTQNYSVYVTHPLDDTYVSQLVEEIKSAARDAGYNATTTVEFAGAFVQSLPYSRDLSTTNYDEYPRYPIETLIDNGGDCEDTSILMAALVTELGYKAVLITFPFRHCAVGISTGETLNGMYFSHKGDRYYYLETTGTAWGLGQIPEELEGITAQIYDMTPTPILTHDWKATIRGNVIELEVTVTNLGSQAAEDVYILTGFDAGDDKILNSKESATFDLAVGQSESFNFTLQTPPDMHTRLIMQIIDGGYAVDDSESDWFDT